MTEITKDYVNRLIKLSENLEKQASELKISVPDESIGKWVSFCASVGQLTGYISVLKHMKVND